MDRPHANRDGHVEDEAYVGPGKSTTRSEYNGLNVGV